MGVWTTNLWPEPAKRTVTKTAQLCPVCSGAGTVPDPLVVEKICHGCKGRGWVAV